MGNIRYVVVAAGGDDIPCTEQDIQEIAEVMRHLVPFAVSVLSQEMSDRLTGLLLLGEVPLDAG